MPTSTPASAKPIFLVGAPRSGTTMLRFMLSAHPNIYIPPESNFLTRFLRIPADQQLSPARAIELFDAILGYKVFFRDWQGQRPQSRAFVESLPDLAPATIIRTLYRQYAAQYGAEGWGDKSPIYTSYIADLAALFPEARFVHIIRDGRDVALSMLKAYQGRRFFYVDLCYAAQSWRRRVQKARSDGAGLGAERYIELRYEQLTMNPEVVLRQLCAFLDVSYLPVMSDPQEMAGRQHHSTGIHVSTRGPVTVARTGRWRTAMSQSDQRIFQAVAGKLLSELGYETVPLGKLSMLEQLKLVGLQSKYQTVETGRRALQHSGVANPATLLAALFK